jgi:uncharacterized protein with FMN-binding domain
MKRSNIILAALVIAVVSLSAGCNYRLTCDPEVPELTEQEGHLTYYFPSRAEFGNLSDGTYYGWITCGRDVAKVKIIVQDNTVIDSEIRYLMVSQYIRSQGLRDDLWTQVPERFIAAQSPQFDAVTGATGSSHLLKICYTRALWNAAGKEDPVKACVPFACK